MANRARNVRHRSWLRAVLIVLAFGICLPAAAQMPPQPYRPAPAPGAIAPAEMEKLVAPIALYPDELLALVLQAATRPVQVVQAARFLDRYAKDKSLKPSASWGEPVTILLHYPDALRKLNDDLDWMERLGEAVRQQQADVMGAIQQFRRRVAAAGNLVSDDKRTVSVDESFYIIESANPQVIYVPVYDPVAVLVPQPVPAPVIYEPTPYPAYYDPAAAATFGFLAGALTTGWMMNWNNWNIDEDDLNDFQEKRQQSLQQRQQSRQDAAQQRQQQRQDASGQRQQERQDASGQRQQNRQDNQQGRQDARDQRRQDRPDTPRSSGAAQLPQQDLRATLGGERPAQRLGGGDAQRPAGGFDRASGGFDRPAGGQRPGYQAPTRSDLQGRGGAGAFNPGSARGAWQSGDRGASSRNFSGGGGGRSFSGGGGRGGGGRGGRR